MNPFLKTAPVRDTHRRHWTADAACANHLPDTFYPSNAHDTCEDARRICAGCPVAEQCREQAIREHDQYAIRGGTSPRERDTITRRRRR